MNQKLLLTFLVFTFWDGPANGQPENVPGEVDRTAIYGSIFEALSLEDSREIYVIDQFSMVPSTDDAPNVAGAFDGYRFDSVTTNHGKEDFGEANVILVPASDMQAMFGDGCEKGWEQFYQKYDSGSKELIGLSDIAVDGVGTKAAVYIETHSDCLLGSGGVLYLENEAGMWSVTSDKFIWGG